jgi:hypothetical protein
MARISLAYPKIPGSKNSPSDRCIAFEKYDGTNLHWVWDRELGWYAFGTRRDRFDLDDVGVGEFNSAHPGMEDAPAIFRENFGDSLERVFRDNPTYADPDIVVFTEYFGAESFAGSHEPGAPKQLVLFDVQTGGGIIGPEQFVDDFGALKIARSVYRGKLTGKFIHDVREGRYGVNEGVVCKGGAAECRWMVKIKTDDYMRRLKEAFQSQWGEYWE